MAYRQRGGRSSHGKIAEASGKFHKSRAGARRWARIANRDHQLAGLQRNGQNAGKELLGGKLAAAGRAGDHHCAIQCNQHARVFGRRIVMGDAAADGAAISDRGMGDLFGRLEQQGPAVPHPAVVQQIGVADQVRQLSDGVP